MDTAELERRGVDTVQMRRDTVPMQWDWVDRVPVGTAQLDT